MDSIAVTIFMQLLISGLISGCIYGLIAIGFVVIYKSTSVVNFAQGEIMMFGAYFCYHLTVNFHLGFWPAFLVTLIFSALLGLLVEMLILRPMIGEPIFSIIMITVGLATLLRSIVGIIWGHNTIPFPSPFSEATVEIFGMIMTPVEIVAILSTIGLFVLLFLFFKYTKLGLATRATAFDQRWAYLMGISVRHIFSLAWILASMVATIGGIFLGLINGLDIGMSFIGLKVFPAVVLGGMESIGGAVLGGILIGLSENMAGGYLSTYFGSGVKELSAFIVLLLVLMFRPYGLFGKEVIIRV